MKSIFEQSSFEEVQSRIKKLNASAKPLWGKMNVGQMLHHLNLAMEAPLGKIAVAGKPKFFMRMFRSVLYNAKPFGKGDPTPKDFKVSGSFDFSSERERVLANLKEIYERGPGGTYLPHVFFGELTSDEWGLHFYKHIDHHLSQFSV